LKIFRYFKSRLHLGLDISTTEIRLLALRRKKQHISVEKMAMIPLPSGAVVEGRIKQTEIVTAYLKTLLQKAGIRHKKVTIALPMQSIISKKIPLTEAPDLNHINDYFPGIDDVLAYDYIEIEKEMLLVAARQDEMMRYINLVENAGLKIDVVDGDIYALARAVHFALHEVQSFPVLLLELVGSQLILLSDNNILYQQAILGTTDQIGMQLKTVLKTYFSKKEPKKIYFVGDASNSAELIEYIHHELGRETQRVNLFNLPCNFLVSCGLALRGIHANY